MITYRVHHQMGRVRGTADMLVVIGRVNMNMEVVQH